MSETVNLLLKIKATDHAALVELAQRDKRSTRNLVDIILSEWVAGRYYRPSSVVTEPTKAGKRPSRFAKPQGREVLPFDHPDDALPHWQYMSKHLDLSASDAAISILDLEEMEKKNGHPERIQKTGWLMAKRRAFKTMGWTEAVDRMSKIPVISFYKNSPLDTPSL